MVELLPVDVLELGVDNVEDGVELLTLVTMKAS
jgi:hypothetical protein